MTTLNALYILNEQAYADIYGPDERARIAALVDIVGPPQTAQSIGQSYELLAQADIILSGWGAPPMDEAFLEAAPRLRAVFYGAGSVRGFVTEALWRRDIRVTSAARILAISVAEYTLATILFSLKGGWHLAWRMRQERRRPQRPVLAGGYGSVVGLISLGFVGRLVRERLRSFDINVLAYDPFITREQATDLGVELVALDELFARSDVVSLHTPSLPETRGMITGHHLSTMKAGATFINTARGAVVRENELIAVLEQRPDLQAILDVTDPEPPEPQSPLYDLPNVVLTPHIAGPLDRECRRMGAMMADELARYIAGEPLQGEVTQQRAVFLA